MSTTSGGLELRAYLNGQPVKREKPVLTVPVRIEQGARPDVFVIKEDGCEDPEISVRGVTVIRRFAIVDSLTSQVLLTYGRDERTSPGGSPISFAAEIRDRTFLVTLKR